MPDACTRAGISYLSKVSTAGTELELKANVSEL